MNKKLLSQCFLILLLSLLWSLQGYTCEDFYQDFGVLTFNRQSLSGNRCALSVHPNNNEDLVYRDYLFMDDGMMMVFNSYGEGPVVEKTGARVFYVFPRGGKLDVISDVERTFVQLAAIDVRIGFENQSGQLNYLSNGEITEEKKVSPDNRGGIEIKIKNGLLLDSGFAIGHDPRGSATATSMFTDRGGNSCVLTNSELFKYTDTDNVNFKWSDIELKSLLQKRCPQLQIY